MDVPDPSRIRVVTLNGPPGSGRTTLAKLCADRMRDTGWPAMAIRRQVVGHSIAGLAHQVYLERFLTQYAHEETARGRAANKVSELGASELIELAQAGGLKLVDGRPQIGGEFYDYARQTNHARQSSIAFDRDPDIHRYISGLIAQQLRQLEGTANPDQPPWVFISGIATGREIGGVATVGLTVKESVAARRLGYQLQAYKNRLQADRAVAAGIDPMFWHVHRIAVDTTDYLPAQSRAHIMTELAGCLQKQFPELENAAKTIRRSKDIVRRPKKNG